MTTTLLSTLLSTAVIQNFIASDDSLKSENIRIIREGDKVRASWMPPNGRELSHDLIPIADFGDVIDDVPETLFTVGFNGESFEKYPDGDVGEYPIVESGLTSGQVNVVYESFDRMYESFAKLKD